MTGLAFPTADILWWLLGFAGASLTVATQFMRTMIPLRVTAITASLSFIGFAVWSHNWLLLLLHLLLLPINALRLKQMMNLIAAARKTQITAELPLSQLQPFMRHQQVEAGEVIFRSGDKADRLFVVLAGRFTLPEINKHLSRGSVVGEIALVKPNRERSQSFVCLEAGTIASVSYEKIEELCQQNPVFGLEFFRLVSSRLITDSDRRLVNNPIGSQSL